MGNTPLHFAIAKDGLSGNFLSAPSVQILEALQPAFAEVSAKTHAAFIVTDLPAYSGSTVQVVDITDLLLD